MAFYTRMVVTAPYTSVQRYPPISFPVLVKFNGIQALAKRAKEARDAIGERMRPAMERIAEVANKCHEAGCYDVDSALVAVLAFSAAP